MFSKSFKYRIFKPFLLIKPIQHYFHIEPP
nr:MAG TPA: hypothetical protein [Bacteriophage sp.]